MSKYKIIRYYFRGGKRTLNTGLTLEQAQAHCQNPESSSETAKGYRARKRTEQLGPWFDGYTKQ